MKNSLTLLTTIFTLTISNAQVGINTENPKSTLDVQKSEKNEILDGIIAPRLTKEELNVKTYTNEQTGALVYVTNSTLTSTSTSQVANIITEGYYYFDGVLWQTLKNNDITDWKISGNEINPNLYSNSTLISPLLTINGTELTDLNGIAFQTTSLGKLESGNFLGSINNEDLALKANNEYVGIINSNNISFGKGSFSKKININGTSVQNNNLIAIGNHSLTNNNGGNGNVAIGAETLITNTTGSNNIAIGVKTLQRNTTSSNSIAIGFGALQHNTDKDNINNTYRSSMNNTVIGVNSTRRLEQGFNVTSLGMSSAQFIKKGDYNTAIGASALEGFNNNNYLISGNIGNYNTAIGHAALASTFSADGTKGNHNTAIGNYAGINVIGNNNIFIGSKATFSSLNHAKASLPTQENLLKELSNVMNIGNAIFGKNILIEGELYTDNSAFIGIGVPEPLYKLDIKPSAGLDPIRIQNIKEGNGSVLVIDQDGVIKKSHSMSAKNYNNVDITDLTNKIENLEEKIVRLEAIIQQLQIQ